MQTIRLVLKLNRFEVAVLAIALVLLSVIALLVAARLAELPAEISACQDPNVCLSLQETLAQLRLQATIFPLLGVVLPIFAGVILGVPVVAREIERGTASLPWTMSPSRRIWLSRRMGILAVILVALSIPPSLALDRLSIALYPGVDLNYSFLDADTRGAIITARALTAFGVAALAGAVVGRILPGILLALVACTALFLGLQVVDDAWARAQAVPLPDGPGVVDSLIVGVGYELPDGRIVDWDTAWTLLDDPSSNPADAFRQRYIGVAVDRAPELRAREIVMILGSGLLSAAAATLVVSRRRPY